MAGRDSTRPRPPQGGDRTDQSASTGVLLQAQKAFVDWWDKQAAKDKGGHHSLYASNSTVTGIDKLMDFALDKMTVSHWRPGQRLEQRYLNLGTVSHSSTSKLFRLAKRFSPDWTVLYGFTRLPALQQKRMLEPVPKLFVIVKQFSLDCGSSWADCPPR